MSDHTKDKDVEHHIHECECMHNRYAKVVTVVFVMLYIALVVISLYVASHY